MLSNNKMTVFNMINRYKNNLKDIIIWSKTQAPPAIEPGVMNTAFEFIFIFSKENPDKRKFKSANFRGNFNNVIRGNNASSNDFAKIHKATFPQYLPEQIILNFTQENEIILDPFVGIGTSALAAKKCKRKYIGIDISQEYVDICNKRLSQQTLL